MENNLFNSLTDPVPPLRPEIQVIPIEQNGEQFLFFQDMMGYAATDFAVPYSARDILSLLNGRNSVTDMAQYAGEGVTKDQILHYVRFLDKHCLLYSDHFRTQVQQIEDEYEEAEVHLSVTAGNSYPADAVELKAFLEKAFTQYEKAEPVEQAKALYAPHIDPQVGIKSYVKAFSSIQNLKPKRVVILATSHYAGLHEELYRDTPFIITGKSFVLPNGKITCDCEAVQTLKKAQNEPGTLGLSFSDRAHRNEHSIELHLLFLNHIWNHTFEILPVLVSGIDELFYTNDNHISRKIEAFSTCMKEKYGDDEDTFFLISGDLAHIGKKFGDPQPARDLFPKVKAFDEAFLTISASGDTEGLLDLMKEDYDPFRICGFPPLYTFLKGFSNLNGTVLDYELWDEAERESAVSFGSILYK